MTEEGQGQRDGWADHRERVGGIMGVCSVSGDLLPQLGLLDTSVSQRLPLEVAAPALAGPLRCSVTCWIVKHVLQWGRSPFPIPEARTLRGPQSRTRAACCVMDDVIGISEPRD